MTKVIALVILLYSIKLQLDIKEEIKMNIYKTTKRIKEKVVRRRRKKRAFGKEGISDEGKNDQRDDKRIKSD